eukprot:TRINITY_DN2720_c1_g1_i2.p4 TRINITY_DN2720_c1_g1~~TRINITY_DN2720_c1_g1_i2.p4  ORF type:complete len:126 (+),score=17.76 TRINITY_DN2720_c1_g1_i2:61-438(+)
MFEVDFNDLELGTRTKPTEWVAVAPALVSRQEGKQLRNAQHEEQQRNSSRKSKTKKRKKKEKPVEENQLPKSSVQETSNHDSAGETNVQLNDDTENSQYDATQHNQNGTSSRHKKHEKPGGCDGS